MRELLTPKAKEVIELAEGETVRFNSRGLSAAHILLGLLLEGTNLGAKALRILGVSVERIHELVEKQDVDHGKSRSLSELIGACSELSGTSGHNYVGPEHLLLFLATDQSSQEFLNTLGIQSDLLRAQVLRLMGEAGRI